MKKLFLQEWHFSQNNTLVVRRYSGGVHASKDRFSSIDCESVGSEVVTETRYYPALISSSGFRKRWDGFAKRNQD